MEIARLWLLVVGMLWVMCWSGQRANGQGTLCTVYKKPSYLILYGSEVHSFTVYKLCEFGIMTHLQHFQEVIIIIATTVSFC